MATRRNRSGGGGSQGGGGWGAWLRYWGWRRWRHGKRRPGDAGGAPMPSTPVRQSSMERGHEPENTSESVGGIIGSVVVLVLSVAVVVGAISAFAGFLGERGTAPLGEAEITEENPPRYHAPPKPRLQVDPAIDLQALHQAEHERLHTYGRVDSARLHIPIARAMRLVNQRGLPADSAGRDSLGAADSIRVPTGSGFRTASRRFPGGPRSDPFLGSSPEPYTPAPALQRRLTEDGYLPRIDSLR